MTSENHSELMAAGMAARVMKFMWKPFGSLTPHGRTSFFGEGVVSSHFQLGSLRRLRTHSTLYRKEFQNADFYVLRQGAGEEHGGNCFIRGDCFHGGGHASESLGPWQVFPLHGAIVGLFDDDDHTTARAASVSLL